MSLTAFYIFCRWLHFSALISLTGAGMVTNFLAPGDYRARIRARLWPLMKLACWLTLISKLLLVSAQTGLLGDGWKDTVNAPLMLAMLQTSFGRAWQLQCGLALAACLMLLLHGAICQRMLLIFAVLQLAGMAFIGHAGLLEGTTGVLQRGNQIVHLLSAGFWAGGLLPVLVLMHDARYSEHRTGAIETMMRYSRYGHLAVAMVIASGALAALLLLGWPLTHFRLYSQLLLVKSLLVAAMVGIALFNRYWLVPRFQQSEHDAQQRFITTTLTEVVLAALALLSVSIFATLDPS